MRHYLTCLWPGLAELWWRGRLSALPLALAFMLAFNGVLITRYIYPEWMSVGLVSMAFWVGLLVWGFAVVRGVRELPGIVAPRSVSDEPDRFADAQIAYLNAQYDEAERLLGGVLAIEPRDPPALLLLAGVYRHTDRLESAELLMAEVRRLEVSDAWHLEVRSETRRLERAKEAANEQDEAETDQDASEDSSADLASQENLATQETGHADPVGRAA